jgi:hypothetical protein
MVAGAIPPRLAKRLSRIRRSSSDSERPTGSSSEKKR